MTFSDIVIVITVHWYYNQTRKNITSTLLKLNACILSLRQPDVSRRPKSQLQNTASSSYSSSSSSPAPNLILHPPSTLTPCSSLAILYTSRLPNASNAHFMARLNKDLKHSSGKRAANYLQRKTIITKQQGYAAISASSRLFQTEPRLI